MSHTTASRGILTAVTLALAPLALPGTTACGLTVTNEIPPYEDLAPDSPARKAIDVIYPECKGLHNRLRKLRPAQLWPIDPVVNSADSRDYINTSFKGKIIVANYGDGRIHISAWENLTDAQRELVRSWFQRPTLAQAEAWYKWMFYRFFAVSQCAKQYMFNQHPLGWVYANRSLYVTDRDTMRTALAYFKEAGRKTEVWNRTATYCAPLLKQYEAKWGHLFLPQYKSNHYKLAKAYVKDNFDTLGDPDAPTGYMYWLCQGIAYEKTSERLETLDEELQWLESLGADN